MAGLWGGLSHTLARLEELAGADGLEAEEALAELPRLQYRLHEAGEVVAGVVPPAAAGPEHAELVAALADARDATAEVLDALGADGPEAALPLVWEWRGALFRVRYARRGLTLRRVQPPADAAASPSPARASAAVSLVLLGAAGLAGGAWLHLWQLWTAGLLALGGSVLAQRP